MIERSNILPFKKPESRNFEVPYGQYLREKKAKYDLEPKTEDGEKGKIFEANTLGVCDIPADTKINPQGSLAEMIAVAKAFQLKEYSKVTEYIVQQVQKHAGPDTLVEYFTAVDSPLDYQQGVDAGFVVDGLTITFDLKTGINTETTGKADMVFALDIEDIKGSVDTFARKVAEHAQGINEYRSYKTG